MELCIHKMKESEDELVCVQIRQDKDVLFFFCFWINSREEKIGRGVLLFVWLGVVLQRDAI